MQKFGTLNREKVLRQMEADRSDLGQDLLDEFFPEVEDGEFIEVRLSGTGGTWPSYWFSSPRDALRFATTRGQRRDAYFGVALRMGETNVDAHVARSNALWLDVDAKCFDGGKPEAREAINAVPVPASAVVDSGNGYHAYWFLKEAVTREELFGEARRVMDGIREWFNRRAARPLDSVSNPSRILRVPGTWNLKEDNPKALPVHVIYFEPERRHALHAFREHGLVSSNATEPRRARSAHSTPVSTLTNAEVVEKASQAQNGEKFQALWRGEWEQAYQSQSEADLALCAMLSFWTNGDAEQIDDLFRESGLHREKWDEGHFAGGGTYGEGTIEKALAGATEFYGGGEASDAADSANSANSATTSEPEQWSPPVPFNHVELPAFPIDALPVWLSAYVEAESIATQTPAELAGMLVLAVCATTVAKRYEVEARPGWREPLNIYVVVALPPGTRKSAVFRDVVAPLVAYERESAQDMADDIREAAAKRRLTERALERSINEACKDVEDAEHYRNRQQRTLELTRELASLSVPLAPRLLADDCTPEKLATLMRDHGGRIAVMSPEGDIFDLMAGRYSATGASNFVVFLKGHAGDDIHVDRVGREPEFVSEPAITMGLAVQPDVIRGLAGRSEFRGRGLLARFLYALPKDNMGQRDIAPPPVPPDVTGGYMGGVERLLTLPTELDERQGICVKTLGLTPQAQEKLRAFEEWLEPELSEFGELSDIVDWGSKLAGAVVRLAGVIHVAEQATTVTPTLHIDAASVERAIRLAAYLIPHAKAAYAEMGADPRVAQAQYLWRWILRSGGETFTRRDAFEGTKGRFKKVEHIEPALALLATSGYVRPRLVERGRGAGRNPSPLYDVNPLARGVAQFAEFAECRR